MKIEWSRASFWMVIVGSVLFLTLLFLGKQIFIEPYQDEVKEKQVMVEQEQRILAAIENNQEDDEREQIISSRAMQQQLPVIPLIDQLLIGLDRAENASTSMINSIAISDSETVIPILDEEAELDEEERDVEAPVRDEPEMDEPGDEDVEQIIDGIHTLQFAIDVTSENYNEMVTFMKEIQSLSRVIQIESIQFDIPENENELGYSLILNSYYQPLYADLRNEAPQYHYGGSPNKVNPFTMEQWNESTPPSSIQNEESEVEEDATVEDSDEGNEEETDEGQTETEAESQL